MITIIVFSALAWYGLGLLGSAIALGSIHRKVGFRNWEEGETLAGYFSAIFGIFNLGGALLFALTNKQGFRPEWRWIRGSR